MYLYAEKCTNHFHKVNNVITTQIRYELQPEESKL